MMTSKRKLMVLQTRSIESISYLADEIVKAFPVDEYEITMVYLESGESRACQSISLGLTKTDYKGLRLKAIRKLKGFLNQHHFDVIIANMYKPINLLMQLRHSVSASLCIGVIHAFGEFDRFGRRIAMRWMIDSRWKIIGVSQPLRDYLINSNCGLDTKNTFVINNAIDVNFIVSNAYTRNQARELLSLPERGFIFGTVGRCVKDKRQMELLRAFHLLVRKNTNAFLIVIGDGELRSELISYVKTNNLDKHVFLPGHVSQALYYLRALDVFVFPSETEGFGLALLEAMALSLPTIVNNIEPLKSIVSGGEGVVEAADINCLEKTLSKYYHMSANDLNHMGLANYERVSNCYDIEKYRQAYKKLVEQHFSIER